MVPLLLWQDIWEIQEGDSVNEDTKDRSTALLVNHNDNQNQDTAISNAAWVHASFMRLEGNYAKTLSEQMLSLLSLLME